MRKALLLSSIILFSFACRKESSVTIPLNEFSKSWIPENQDSIVYTSLVGDTIYLTFDSYSAQFLTDGNGNKLEQVTQQGFTSDTSFYLNYKCSSGFPSTDSVGSAIKTDLLELQSANSFGTISIGNRSISTDLLFIDSLYLPDSTLYLNVFTDGSSYYLNQQQKIIQLKSGADWFYRD